MKINLLIQNKEIETAHYTEIRDPGRLDNVVGLIAKGCTENVDQAVQAAHKAFLTWRKTSLNERISLLLKAADRLEEEIPSLAEIVSKENGMLLGTTKAEIGMAITCIRNIADLAKPFFEPKLIEDETGWVSLTKKPMGVIAGIVPWNAPIVLTMQKFAPAVVSGNTIVFKPSPFAPIGVSVALKKISELFPPGVINVVHGDGDVGSALSKHPLVRKISFTGGGKTAKYVMKDAAESLKSIHFELGGNDPAIVLDDVDLNKVVPEIVSGIFRRSGQFCFAIKRVYIPHAIYDEFYEKICECTDQFKIGHQLDSNVTFGPINNRQQYDYVKELIKGLEESGANMVTLGEKLDPTNWNNGYYLRPVIVRDVDPNHEIVTSEQFGPIIPLVPYRTEKEVIEMTNNTEYGLGSSIWSSNIERALRIADEVEAGMTFINGCGQTALGYKHIPFGGVKQSGIGRENSEIVFGEYIEYHGINIHKA